MPLHCTRPLICLALLAGSADAQFLNPAVWLGDDQESFRRDYGQDAEYFLNRAAYIGRPPWRRSELYDPFRDQLSIAGGSVTSSELTIEALANVGFDLGRGFAGRFNYLQSENQTNQFERFAVGLDASVTDSTSLFMQLEGTPDKSRADVSVGVELFRDDHSAHRLSLTLVDFAQGKSEQFEYERMPYGLLFAGFSGSPQSVGFAYQLGVQLPFEQRDLDSGDLLSMQRMLGSCELSTPLNARDSLILGLEGELTSKQLEPGTAGMSTSQDADIDKARITAEWWRRGDSGGGYSLGAYYQHLDEAYAQPDDPSGSAGSRRRELMLFTSTQLPLQGAWSIEPYLIGGHVELENHGAGLEPVDASKDGFEGRFGIPLVYQFSALAWMRFDLSMQLDQFAFGGAGVQLVASL